MAHLMGVIWVHGMAFGSLVVPDEKRMFIGSLGWRTSASIVSSEQRNSSHAQSAGREAMTLLPRVDKIIAGGAAASINFAYRGNIFWPRIIVSWVKTNLTFA